jgi:CheY-like chemotaxis protein
MSSSEQTTRAATRLRLQARPAGNVEQGTSMRILVADDSRDVTYTLGLLLEFMGHEVRTARDGLEVLEVAEEFEPQVVFLDLGMPRMDGYEACRQIRLRPWGVSATLVALTGWSQEQHRQRSREVGFDHHLVKPIDAAVLEGFLSQARPAER